MNESLKVRGRTPLLQPREKGLKTRPGLITSSQGRVSPSQSDRQHALFAFRSSPYLSLSSFSLLILRFFPFFAFPFFLPFHFRLYLLYTRFLRSISFKEAWIIVSYFLSYPLPPLFSTKYFKCIVIFHFFYRPHEILSYFGNRLNRCDGNIDSELSFLDTCERWKKVRLEIVDHFYDKIKSWMTRE